LISREWMLKEVERIGSRNMLWTYIHGLITNAPAVSGEAVAKYKINANGFESPRWLTHQEKFNGVTGKDYKLLYTTPQQPQSVADYVIALEVLVNILKPKYGDIGSRDIEVTAKLNAIKDLFASRPKSLPSAPKEGE